MLFHAQANAFIQGSLFAAQLDVLGNGGFFRQFGSHLLFGAAQDKRRNFSGQLVASRFHAVFFNGIAKDIIEKAAPVQQTGQGKIHQRPELAQVIFQRCARQA